MLAGYAANPGAGKQALLGVDMLGSSVASAVGSITDLLGGFSRAAVRADSDKCTEQFCHDCADEQLVC